MKKWFAEFVINNRKVVIAVIAVITLFFGYFLKDIKVNPDVMDYLPKNDAVAQRFNYIDREYGGNALAMVAIETDDVFTKASLRQVADITAELKLLPGVSYVTSLTDVLDIKKAQDGGIEIGKLIDAEKLPETDEEIGKLRKYVMSSSLFSGKLVSTDGKATLIVCRLNENVNKIVTAGAIRGIVKKAEGNNKAYYAGSPFFLADIVDLIMDDLYTLIPIIVVVIVMTLFFSFRVLRGVVIPLISVAISVIWTIGLMNLLRIPLSLISNIIPVVLFAVGNAYSIHVFSKFNEDVLDNTNRLEQSKSALSNVALPVLLAAVTTVAGFLSFIFGSYLTMIVEFGIFTAVGTLFALIIACTLVPAILAMLPVQAGTVKENARKSSAKPVIKFMDSLGVMILKNEKLVLVIAGIITIIAVAGIPRIQRSVNITDYFKKDSHSRLSNKILDAKFGGSSPIMVIVKGDMTDPRVLNEMVKFQDFLDQLDDVNNTQSITNFIEQMSDVMGEGKNIPEDQAKVSNLWFLLEGQETLSQMVNPDKTEAIVQAMTVHVPTTRIRAIIKAIREYLKQNTKDYVSFEPTGMLYINDNLDNSLVSSQFWSMLIALFLVFLCLLAMMRSFAGGVIGIVPITFTIIVIFGVMGYTGIPLDIATVLVASIAIGTGIDYSIHFVNRFRHELKVQLNEFDALRKTLETTGRAIMINVVTVMFGFLVLIFANLVPLQRFGLLTAVTTLVSGVSAITILPAIILLFKPKIGEDK
ncbi:MAG: MMPL family transporter [Elusimicrobiota bacterium]